jgi:hypothetical protein
MKNCFKQGVQQEIQITRRWNKMSDSFGWQKITIRLFFESILIVVNCIFVTIPKDGHQKHTSFHGGFLGILLSHLFSLPIVCSLHLQ